MKINKIATILIIALTLFFAFSILYIINNVDHDCAGENCPICEQIIKCEENIEGLGFSVLELILKIAICTTFIYEFLL